MLRSFIDVEEEHSAGFKDIDVITLSGKQKLSAIVKGMDKQAYYIPNKWPVAKDQRGPCCGLYSLEIALHYGFTGIIKSLPPARKDKNKHVISLRSVAKKKNLSGFGEIYDVNTFATLTDYFKIPSCEVLPVDAKLITEKQYINTIIDRLDKYHTVIVSSDLGMSFPTTASGLHTHWALVFGYYKENDKVSFLVTQYGHYYSWDGAELYKSNQALPDKNPKVGPTYAYCAVGAKGEKEYTRSIPVTETEKARYAVGDTLDKFRYGLFAVPAHPSSRTVELPEAEPEPVSYKRHKPGFRQWPIE